MSAEKIIEYKSEEKMTDGNRGLHYEENLLWEKEHSDHSGVDMPAPANLPLKTGTTARENIGLPQVSEPQALRHFVRMSTWNYSIDHGFFPLGSCTMKHNPRLNEKMARLPGFAAIHPLQPASTVQGALGVMYELQNWLAELTGLPGVCMTPAAGAHGELAGIMTIRRKHELSGEGEKRRIILTPDSSHGTNPATAAMCGYEVRNIPTKDTGGILSIEAFKEALYKTDENGADVAGMMVTNPNTCGLFEKNIAELSKLLHEAGGYFYMDGANFNALVGKIRPADFGVDVMHINLHKTFSTPHGGGGPGSGPICCTEELAPYLPMPIVRKRPSPTAANASHEAQASLPSPAGRGCLSEARAGEGMEYYLEGEGDRESSLGTLKGFQGQFGMFVRALTYMLSHGKDGLKQVSEDAVLNANYILRSLETHYHAPFAANGHCMHEALLTDKRQKEKGVQTLDIAKMLVERGFHPMTVYFPLVLPGTMLIEPTETESKDALDRFITVMKEIAQEIDAGDAEEKYHAQPQSTPRRRLDEVKAARNPVLRWEN